jgi:diguanylate cyclase (GGDEF)-like protein/PAS domain S-box-containing protein
VTTPPAEPPPADRHSAFANAPMGVALCTPDAVLLDVNPFLERMLRRSADELRGRTTLDFLHADDVPGAVETWERLRRVPDRPARYECRLVPATGSAVPVQTTSAWAEPGAPGGQPHIVVFIEDITDRKVLEAQLVHRSLHDPLTGLPNRLLFRDRLRHALDRGHREHTPTCVLVIDLDGFKEINDAHGHAVGDAVLVTFAERLRSVLRASDTAARLGGDEFSIVCENTDRADAVVLAERLRRSLRDPLTLQGVALQVGMSIGIGEAPGGAEATEEVLEELVREADDAMYADKLRRRG